MAKTILVILNPENNVQPPATAAGERRNAG